MPRIFKYGDIPKLVLLLIKSATFDIHSDVRQKVPPKTFGDIFTCGGPV